MKWMKKCGKVPENQARIWCAELVSPAPYTGPEGRGIDDHLQLVALEHLHKRRVVHRDVKPGNLLLQADGSVMLVDFGVARSTTANTRLTSTNAIIGTALYMAPEQASGQNVSPATDIYALGAVAYHCLAGHPPFPGENPLEVAVRHVTAEAAALPEDILERMGLADVLGILRSRGLRAMIARVRRGFAEQAAATG